MILIIIDLKHLSIELFYENLDTFFILYSFLKVVSLMESTVFTFRIHTSFLT